MSIQSTSEAVRRIYTVTELNRLIGDLLEQSLPRIWLEAEVSNLRRPGAHWYFSLKDADAQLRCAMFRGANIHVRPAPKDGDQVLVRGRIALYGARGVALAGHQWRQGMIGAKEVGRTIYKNHRRSLLLCHIKTDPDSD